MTLGDILTALGGYRAIAGELGLPSSTVYYWRRRGSVPHAWWPMVIALAVRAGRHDITAAVLLAAHAVAQNADATGDEAVPSSEVAA